jgi:phage baseplate assembly protein V
MSPRQIKEMLARAQQGVRSAFRGVLGQLSTNQPIQLASIDGLAGEAIGGLELFQQFGCTSAPPEGSTVIVLPLGGRTSASVILATEHGAYRLRVAAGEVALYNQDGDHVWLKRNGRISVKASAQVEIDAPMVRITHDLAVGGNLTAVGSITDKADSGGESMEQMRGVFNDHDHDEHNTSGPTGRPNQSM